MDQDCDSDQICASAVEGWSWTRIAFQIKFTLPRGRGHSETTGTGRFKGRLALKREGDRGRPPKTAPTGQSEGSGGGCRRPVAMAYQREGYG